MNSLKMLILSTLLLVSTSFYFGQNIQLGSAANFVLFSTNGAISNTGISQITGNVGTNNGSSTAFGNVNGQMHDNDLVSMQCANDLLLVYNQLNTEVPSMFPAPLLGNGQILAPGVYSISAAATLNLELTFNANGNANAIFIIQIQGPLSTNANSTVKLTNGAKACNVYWKVEGLVDMASGTSMRGNIIANNSAINMNTNVSLEGRALSTAGAITVDGVYAYTPTGCGSPIMNGPAAPNLASTECYSLFSANGSMTNTGTTHLSGDVGTNVGLTTGFDPLLVSGEIHLIPDLSTSICAVDLGNVYTYLNTLPLDIELLYPVQFGRDLVLTPHVYLLDGATTLTNKLYLDAQGKGNAVFVIRVNGALETSTYSQVILTNGTQAKNVFWVINGAVEINDFSKFNGSIICNNGAVSLKNGSQINGRIFTTDGAFTSDSIQVELASNCTSLHVDQLDQKQQFLIYPNPFTDEIHIQLTGTNTELKTLRIFNLTSQELLYQTLNTTETIIKTNQFPSGVYFYQINNGSQIIQTGKLVSQK